MSNQTQTSPACVPFFWPWAVGAEIAEGELKLAARNLKFLAESEKIDFGLHPQFATENRILLDLRTMRVRDFSSPGAGGVPTLVDAPYAGHTATAVDFDTDQSLMATLRANGCRRIVLTDWKAATHDMKDFDVDTYLAEINVVVDDLGGRVNLVGLCQGGWMSAIYAARFPEKVNTLVLAGSPIDTAAGLDSLRKLMMKLPMAYFEELVALGGGLMPGRFMLAGYKNMDPAQHYLKKYVDLYKNIDDPDYLRRQERFASWYESPIDLPGRVYLQVVDQLFKQNQLVHGDYVALGKKLLLKDVRCPAYLLAGSEDDITPWQQVFNAEEYLGTPKDQIVKTLAPGGHIGLFMGRQALAEDWPVIGAWIAAPTADERAAIAKKAADLGVAAKPSTN
ncbi:MAG: alpha/beta fold hydrolase [Candidatus Baltobacteraceae bacterium]